MTATDTETATDDQPNRPDDFEMIEDAATLAYAVYRCVDFDDVRAAGRDFEDEFVSYLEVAASIRETVTEFHQELAGSCDIRAIHPMDGDVRRIVRKYDGKPGRAASRRFLRTIRRNPAHVRLEMKHQFSDGNGGET